METLDNSINRAILWHTFACLISGVVLASFGGRPLAHAQTGVASDPFADFVEEVLPGDNAGFGSEELPDIVLGPPQGAGEVRGSSDVLSLGNSGSIVLGFDAPVICDGPGADFTIFENAFLAGSLVFSELAYVAVSQGGESFVEFPVDRETGTGFAGRSPVYSNPTNGIDPRDTGLAGGDSFDLADIDIASAAFIRIVDAGPEVDDPGNALPPGNTAGFDLDAVVILNPCPGFETPTPDPATSPTPIPMIDGDINGDGIADRDDLLQIVSEIFDGDGSHVADVRGGLFASAPLVDSNRDEWIGAADLVAEIYLIEHP